MSEAPAELMPALRRTTLIATGVLLLAAACWERHAETNDERAYLTNLREPGFASAHETGVAASVRELPLTAAS